MKSSLVLVIGVCCLALLTPGIASAKGGGKKGRKDNSSSSSSGSVAQGIMAKYDANGDGTLDATETAKLKADFAAGNATEAASYDANRNGKLDDSEIGAIKSAAQSTATTQSGGKKKKKK